MTAYIRSKTQQVDGVLDIGFQDLLAWPQTPPPEQLTDTCMEVTYMLVCFIPGQNSLSHPFIVSPIQPLTHASIC